MEVELPVRVFEVTKVHHEKNWLRQTRLLVITPDSVMKADPSELPLGEAVVSPEKLNPSKVHNLTSLLQVELFSRTKFSLHFRGDHPYFYKSSDALEIVRILQERRGFQRAAHALRPDCPQHAVLQLAGGSLNMASEQDASVVCAEKLDFIRIVRANGIDGSENVHLLAARVNAFNESMSSTTALSSEGSIAFLQQFRKELGQMRDKFVLQCVTRERSWRSKLCAKMERKKLPRFCDSDAASLCVEEALESMIFDRGVFHVLWLHCTAVATERQKTFDANCDSMSRCPLSYFGIHPNFWGVKFDLVLEHLNGLDKCLSPAAMLNTIFSAVKAILLCVEAHFLNHEDRPALDVEYSTDDLLPVLIYVMVRGKTRKLCVVETFVVECGDPSESTERAYYFTVFASALRFVVEWTNDQPDLERSCTRDHSPFSTPRLLREMSPDDVPTSGPSLPQCSFN